jgi:hypothetical protein
MVKYKIFHEAPLIPWTISLLCVIICVFREKEKMMDRDDAWTKVVNMAKGSPQVMPLVMCTA